MFPIIVSLFIINMAYIVYFSFVTFRLGVQTSKRIPEPDTKKVELLIAKQKTKLGRFFVRIAIILFVLIFISLILGASSYFIWIPILVWNNYGPLWGIISLALIAFSDTYLKVLIFRKRQLNPKLKELMILSDSIKYFAIVDAFLLFSNLEGQSLYQILQSIYHADFFMNTTLMVFIPTAYSVLLLANVIVIIKRTKFLFNKNLDKYRATTKRSILLLVVSTSFFGLFYLNQLDLGFVSIEDAEAIRGAMNTYGVLLSAIFIPLFLDALQNRSGIVDRDKPNHNRPYRRLSGTRPCRGSRR